MREPIPHDVEFAWHRAAMAGYPQPIHNDEPQPGFFKRRLVKGGVFVPARIYWEQEIGDDGELVDQPVLRCEIDGMPADALDQWSYLAGSPISETEHRYLTARDAWATWFAPDDFAARPRERIDPLKTPILF